MNKNYTFIVGAIGVVFTVLDKFSDTFADYPLVAKFLPVVVAIVLGLVAYYNLHINPDGTPASQSYIKPDKDSGPRFTGMFLVLLLLVPTFQAATCKESSAYKKAVQACYDISVGVNASVQITMDLNKQGVLSAQDYLAILELEKALVQSNEEFRKLLSNAGEINTTNKLAFIALLDSVGASLANLQAQGTLRIKNPNSQALFSATLATVRTGLIVVKGFIEQVKSTSPLPKSLKAQALPQMSKEYYNLSAGNLLLEDK